MSNVLFYYNTRFGSFSNDILYETIESYFLEGKDVHILFCDLKKSSCHTNLNGNIVKCLFCRIGSKITLGRFSKKPHIHYIRETFNSNLDFPDKLSEYRNFTHNGINVGLGALSSYVSLTRNINENLTNEDKTLLKKLVITGIQSLNAFSELVESNTYEEIVFFNGRFSEVRSILEYCEKNSLNYKTIEFDTKEGFSKVKKLTFDNSLPHSKEVFKANYNLVKQNNDSEYFQRRLKGTYNGDKIYSDKFLKSDTEKYLKNPVIENNINIVYFMSSEDEIFALGDEWKTTNFIGNQYQNIEWLIDYYKNRKKINFIIRAHPNLSSLSFEYVGRHWKKIKYPNIFYIEPESTIDTYSLISVADLCIGFSSSVLVECSYYGKKTVLLGDSFFKNLDICEEPKNKEELIHLLEYLHITHETLDKRKENAIKYGELMLSSFGLDYNLFNWNLFMKTKPFPAHWFFK